MTCQFCTHDSLSLRATIKYNYITQAWLQQCTLIIIILLHYNNIAHLLVHSKNPAITHVHLHVILHPPLCSCYHTCTCVCSVATNRLFGLASNIIIPKAPHLFKVVPEGHIAKLQLFSVLQLHRGNVTRRGRDYSQTGN